MSKKLWLLFLLFFTSCKIITIPDISYEVEYITNKNYSTGFTNDRTITITINNTNYITNYYTNHSKTDKETKMPTLDSVFIDSEYGYFQGSKTGNNIFTVPMFTEAYYQFDTNMLKLLVDVDVVRTTIEMSKASDSEKKLNLTLLGANILTNNYTVILKHAPNTSAAYAKWQSMACSPEKDRWSWSYTCPYYTGPANASFDNWGKILYLSRTGNRNSYLNNAYTYDLVRVIGSGDTAMFKNRDTGSFICVKIRWEWENNTSVKKLYMVKPESSEFILQHETPYNTSLASTIISYTTFSKYMIWNQMTLSSALDAMGDVLNLIMLLDTSKNEAVSLKTVSSSGYLLHQWDWNSLVFWGRYD